MFRTGLAVLLLTGIALQVQAAEPMADAAKRGDVQALRSQLATGMNVNQRFDIGQSALLIAARSGHLAAVQALVEKGADLNLQDNNGDTAVHLAAAYDRRDVVNYLLNAGADPRIMNGAGRDLLVNTQVLAQSDSSLQPMVRYLADSIPKLPQYRARRSDGAVTAIKEMPGVGEPALFVHYVTVDVSQYKASADTVRRASRNALLRRGWKIIGSEPDREIGSLTRKGQEYRVEVRFLRDTVRIAFLNGYHSERPNYLQNLEHDMVLELQLGAPRS